MTPAEAKEATLVTGPTGHVRNHGVHFSTGHGWTLGSCGRDWSLPQARTFKRDDNILTGCVVGGRPGLGFVKAGGKLEVGWERRSEMEAWAGRNGRFHLQRVGRTHNKPAMSESYRRETKLYKIQSFAHL
ncbi:hypothetical protein Bbelb_424660 [Branchiostoma belcheri]|nr:hypothetical protein Bbelb_424660 [Branchiostoma belcheri]